MDKDLQRYFEIARRMQSGDVPEGKDIEFFLSFSPKINKASIQKLIDNGDAASTEEVTSALLEAGRQLQSSPGYKDALLKITQDAEKKGIADDLASGINLVLAGSDIAQSLNQIRQSNNAVSRSKRPSRPVVPGRDAALAQALRGSQENVNDAGRALGAAKAEIQDQYQNDIQNAKTASTGQAGAFGSYAQVAADRRNRAALGLGPIQDEIRRGQQARTDALIGARMGETQQMYENNAQFYPNDLQQYNNEQNAAATLGAVGRSNLNNSLYNFGQAVVPTTAELLTQRRYRNLRNKAAAMYGNDIADTMVKADRTTAQEWGGPLTADDTPGYWMGQ